MAMSDKAYSRSLDKIIVRLPDGMRDRLAKAAAANKRSVNAEVVERLQITLDADDKITPSVPINKEEIDRIASFAAAQAAVEAIDAVLGMLSLPDGTPDAERFETMLKKSRSTTPSTPTPKREKAK